MFPFIAAIAQAGGIIIDKITLTRRQVSLHVFVPILFLFLFLSTALLAPALARILPEFFQAKYLLLFGMMLVFAVIWNIFYYRGAQLEKVHEFELIIMFQPLLTVLLASIFLRGEQNWQIILAAAIASIALIVSHLNQRHFEFSDGKWSLILAVVFMSAEIILIKLLLAVFSPVALYAVRTGILFLFFYFYYHPQLNKVADTNVYFILSTALLGTLQMVTKFYGFERFGVIYTSLILIISPFLVYIISTIFLHEKLKPRTIFAAIVILICIIYATVAENKIF